MPGDANISEPLSPWWRHAVILTMAVGFTILIWLATKTYKDAPPIPEKVVSPSGETIFTGEDVLAGQQVFLKYGLMENGTIWGHGAYLGPDFSAEYLHALAVDASETVARWRFNRALADLTAADRAAVKAEVQELLKKNRYDPSFLRRRNGTPAQMDLLFPHGRWFSGILSGPVSLDSSLTCPS